MPPLDVAPNDSSEAPPQVAMASAPLPESIANAPAAMPQQPQQQEQTAQQPLPQAPPEAHTHRSALAGVLAGIAGPNKSFSIDPQTGKMQETDVPPSPGDAFKRILASALIGMGAGAAAGSTGRPGAGVLGGIGAGAIAAGGQRAAFEERQRNQAQQDFSEDQKLQLNRATIAHLNAMTVAETSRATRDGAEIDMKAANALNDMREQVAANPQNRDLGHYASFNEFLQKHQDIAPNIAELQSQAAIRVFPTYEDGKPTGFQIFQVHPDWANQKNEKPVDVPYFSGVDENGNPKTSYQHFDVGQISNGDAWKAFGAYGLQSLRGAVTPETRYVQEEENKRAAAHNAIEWANANKDQNSPVPDPFGAALPQVGQKEYNKRFDSFGRDYVKDLNSIERSYQQMSEILENARKTGKITGPESIVGLFNAIGLSSAPLKGRGFRINNEVIGHHVGMRGVIESMRNRLQALDTGQIVTANQLGEYERILADARRDAYAVAGNEALRQGLPRNFLPSGNGNVLDPQTALIFYTVAGKNKDAARKAAQELGWKVQ